MERSGVRSSSSSSPASSASSCAGCESGWSSRGSPSQSVNHSSRTVWSGSVIVSSSSSPASPSSSAPPSSASPLGLFLLTRKDAASES
eukprot:scaffold314083_cov31-Tisochrysis_lutea.AAC.1